eukprot:gene8804-1172_t
MNSPGADSMEDSAVEENMPRSSRLQKLRDIVHEMNESELVQSLNIVLSCLKQDFVLALPSEICGQIFEKLGVRDLIICESVSKRWREAIYDNNIWRHFFTRTLNRDRSWQLISMKIKFIQPQLPIDWKYSYAAFTQTVLFLQNNWKRGTHNMRTVNCEGDGIYTLQYDDTDIFTGNRDDTIKIWDSVTLELKRSIKGHSGSVLCLQYDKNKVITSSSDHSIRIWDRHEDMLCVKIINYHTESVLHVRFDDQYMVSCSKDRRVVIWKQQDDRGFDYEVLHVLEAHRAAVNVVEFDKRHVVSASGDRTIMIWNTATGEHLRTLTGHERGIACIQYQGKYVVSGSSDETIRVWDVEDGNCIQVLRGHTALVRCVRFNEHFIVSGSYDGTVRVWDFHNGSNIVILYGHTSRVFRVQFDDTRIISSSQDDTLRVWDFSLGAAEYFQELIKGYKNRLDTSVKEKGIASKFHSISDLI